MLQSYDPSIMEYFYDLLIRAIFRFLSIEIDERNKFVLRIVTMEDFKKNSERKEYFPIFHSNKRENVFVDVKFVNREEFLIEPFPFN